MQNLLGQSLRCTFHSFERTEAFVNGFQRAHGVFSGLVACTSPLAAFDANNLPKYSSALITPGSPMPTPAAGSAAGISTSAVQLPVELDSDDDDMLFVGTLGSSEGGDGAAAPELNTDNDDDVLLLMPSDENDLIQC